MFYFSLDYSNINNVLNRRKKSLNVVVQKYFEYSMSLLTFSLQSLFKV
jgi:hypothetical protein